MNENLETDIDAIEAYEVRDVIAWIDAATAERDALLDQIDDARVHLAAARRRADVRRAAAGDASLQHLLDLLTEARGTVAQMRAEHAGKLAMILDDAEIDLTTVIAQSVSAPPAAIDEPSPPRLAGSA